ncbi:MAG: preQ(1) synthase [bacterium]|nr:preQ(1) synthase [bacterium]
MEQTTKYLGRQTNKPLAASELDAFNWDEQMMGTRPPVVSFETDEFTHICPVTSQPDFGHLKITYRPFERLLETKSLKLYLMGFRTRESFDERLVAEIALGLFKRLEPVWVEVTGTFKSRGGIRLRATKLLPDPVGRTKLAAKEKKPCTR